MLARPRGRQLPAVLDLVCELTGMGRERASEALRDSARLLDSVEPELALSAVERIHEAGGEAHVELGWVERYARDPSAPLRGELHCERVAIFDGCLTLTRGNLSRDAVPQTLLERVDLDQLFAGFDAQRERWAASGLRESADELALLTELALREPPLDAALREAEDDEQLRAHAKVYSDWLQLRGDPRGRLTVLEAGASERDRRLFDMALDAVADHVLGSFYLDLREDDHTRLDWCGPILERAQLGPRHIRTVPPTEQVLRLMQFVRLPRYRRPALPDPTPTRVPRDLGLLRHFLTLPASAAVRELELGGRYLDEAQCGELLAQAPCAASLRRLRLSPERSLVLDGQAFPRLEQLELQGLRNHLRGRARFAALRELLVEFDLPNIDLGGVLGSFVAPELESLRLDIGVTPEHAGRLPNELAHGLGRPSVAGVRRSSIRIDGPHTVWTPALTQVLLDAPQRDALTAFELRGCPGPECRARLERAYGTRLTLHLEER